MWVPVPLESSETAALRGAESCETTAAAAKAFSLEVGRPSPVDVKRPTDDTASSASSDLEHYSTRAPWLRAALLGANDGLVSVAALMAGVGAVREDVRSMAISGLAGLIAGACSMAIGEYVSVNGQRDAELADIERERARHAACPESELAELAQIYEARGLSHSLARQVAEELSKGDTLKVHARDELGIDVDHLSNPLQAALASASSFTIGGLIPFISAIFVRDLKSRLPVLFLTSSVALLTFGALGAWLGGAPKARAALRVLLGGWMAILITYTVLRVCGTAGL